MLANKNISRLSSFMLILMLLLNLAQPSDAARALPGEPAAAGSIRFMQDGITPTPTDVPVSSETPIATETPEPTEIPVEEPTSAPVEMLAAEAGDVNVLAVVTLYVKSSGGSDFNDCLSAALACATINGAIGKASDGDTVKVSAGSYTGSSSEVVLINKSITLSGGWNSGFISQDGMSTIDGQNLRRGITTNSGTTMTIERFLVQNGSNNDGGAGIWNDGALTLNNSDISDNKSNNGAGGGIWNSILGTLTLNDSIVSDNETYYGGNGILNSGTMTINNSTISNNSALPVSASGGGIFNTATLTLNNSTVSNNNAGDGGGIFNNGGNETINNSTITGNHAQDKGGGIRSSGSTILNNSTVAHNTSSYTAGGIYNFSTFTASNSTISDNTANCEAGGIFNQGTFTLNNSTVSANTVGCYGGGILNDPSGSVTLRNTILAGNISTSIHPDCRGTLDSAGYNLIGNNTGCTFNATTGDQVGTNSTPIEARLSPLQNNGGVTFTRALIGGSPAINAGNPAIPGSGGNACLSQDQLGVTRPVDATCDIGAYEGHITVVNSITLLDPNPTQASSVNFLVTFSEAVTGVNTSAPFNDFALTIGMTTASISAVNGSGASYTVTVNNNGRIGTIRLDVIDDGSIKDISNTKLGGVGAGYGTFTSGESYLIRPSRSIGVPRLIVLGTWNPSTFGWINLNGGLTYEIAFATDSAFTNIVHSNNNAVSPYTPPVFVDGTYYWRVRAINPSNQVGAWSSARTFTIDTTGPSTPVLSSPAHNASTRSPTFRWGSVAGAVLYEFQYDNDSGFPSPAYTVTTRGTFRRPPALPIGTYYWRVRAKDAAGNWGAWSAPFTVNITGP